VNCAIDGNEACVIGLADRVEEAVLGGETVAFAEERDLMGGGGGARIDGRRFILGVVVSLRG